MHTKSRPKPDLIRWPALVVNLFSYQCVSHIIRL
nr:MAG TPA: hypothetical protein [Bacteriophage sp.]